jgi:hypothetical protein
VFGTLFSTRLIHYYALTGMAFLAAGVLMLRAATPLTGTLALAGSGLVGVGIGASVVPALFLAGFSLRSASIQRVFAILELLRAVAAFLVVPLLLHFAVTLAGLPSAAFNTTLWVCFALPAGGAVVGVLLYLLGGVRPSAPALTTWMGGQEQAWECPPLLATLRPGAAHCRRWPGRPQSPCLAVGASSRCRLAIPAGTRPASGSRLARCCSSTTAPRWPWPRSPRPGRREMMSRSCRVGAFSQSLVKLDDPPASTVCPRQHPAPPTGLTEPPP